MALVSQSTIEAEATNAAPAATMGTVPAQGPFIMYIIGTKKEITANLSEILTGHLLNSFRNLYKQVRLINDTETLKLFQLALCRIPTLSSTALDNDYEQFKKSTSNENIQNIKRYLSIMAQLQVIIKYVKRHNTFPMEKLEYQTRTIKELLHHCYIRIARKLWAKPELLSHKYPQWKQHQVDVETKEIIQTIITGVVDGYIALDELHDHLLNMNPSSIFGYYSPPDVQPNTRPRIEEIDDQTKTEVNTMKSAKDKVKINLSMKGSKIKSCLTENELAHESERLVSDKNIDIAAINSATVENDQTDIKDETAQIGRGDPVADIMSTLHIPESQIEPTTEGKPKRGRKSAQKIDSTMMPKVILLESTIGELAANKAPTTVDSCLTATRPKIVRPPCRQRINSSKLVLNDPRSLKQLVNHSSPDQKDLSDISSHSDIIDADLTCIRDEQNSVETNIGRVNRFMGTDIDLKKLMNMTNLHETTELSPKKIKELQKQQM